MSANKLNAIGYPLAAVFDAKGEFCFKTQLAFYFFIICKSYKILVFVESN